MKKKTALLDGLFFHKNLFLYLEFVFYRHNKSGQDQQNTCACEEPFDRGY